MSRRRSVRRPRRFRLLDDRRLHGGGGGTGTLNRRRSRDKAAHFESPCPPPAPLPSPSAPRYSLFRSSGLLFLLPSLSLCRIRRDGGGEGEAR